MHCKPPQEKTNLKGGSKKLRVIKPGQPLAFRPGPDVATMLTRAMRDRGAYAKIVNKALRKYLVEQGYAGKRELAIHAELQPV